jgi:hypothetical protein
MSAEANGDFSIEVRVDEHEDLGQYPKAGLMVRSSLAADSPSLLLSVFPSGNIQVAYRAEAGAETTATVDIEDGSGIGALLRLERIGDEFIASVDGAEVERIEWENAPDSMQVGPVALSHSNDQLIRIFYSDLTFNP